MTAKLLDGKALSNRILTDITNIVATRKQNNLPIPGLAVIIVGDDPASHIYVRHKRLACEKVGFHSEVHDLAGDVTEQELVELIQGLNHNPKIHGILLQLPLPAHLDNVLLEHISPHKDVDGFHPYNMGRLAQQKPTLRPCTPYGIITLLKEYQIQLRGIDAVVVGASNIVGRPMALELLLEKSTVTVCHSATSHLNEHIERADLLISAIGNTEVINPEWIKPGAIVVDVGMNRLADGKIQGDIDFSLARERASWITPVPGGVGPMTVAMLLQNTLSAANKEPHQI